MNTGIVHVKYDLVFIRVTILCIPLNKDNM